VHLRAALLQQAALRALPLRRALQPAPLPLPLRRLPPRTLPHRSGGSLHPRRHDWPPARRHRGAAARRAVHSSGAGACPAAASAEDAGSSEEEERAALRVRSTASAAAARAAAGHSTLLQGADLVEVLSRVAALCAASLCRTRPWLAVLVVAACADAWLARTQLPPHSRPPYRLRRPRRASAAAKARERLPGTPSPPAAFSACGAATASATAPPRRRASG